jgi:hypothetical protein
LSLIHIISPRAPLRRWVPQRQAPSIFLFCLLTLTFSREPAA